MRSSQARIESGPDSFGSTDNFTQDLFAEIPGAPSEIATKPFESQSVNAGMLSIQPEMVPQRRSVKSTVEIIRLNKGIKFDPRSNLIDASDHFKAKQTLQEQAMVFQRMQAAAAGFDPDQCGGRNEGGSRSEIGSLSNGSNITNLAERRMKKILGGNKADTHADAADHCKHQKHKNECDDAECRVA